MSRFRVFGVAVGLTIALCVVQTAAAVAAPTHNNKLRPDSGVAKLVPYASTGVLAPSGVNAALESELNDDPTQADPILMGLNQEGSVNWDTDPDDVYSIALNPGDEIEVRMYHNWSPGDEFADLDLYLYGPGTDQYFEPGEIDWSENWGVNVEFLRYVIPPTGGGTYFIDVYAWDTVGSVSYSLDVSVNDAMDTSGVKRLYGESRYDTAVEISRGTFPDGGCDTVVLATGANFPDALSASGLAGIYRGPLLLTRRDSVPDSVLQELERLGATDIVIVGGTGAVSPVVKELLELYGYTVTRISGTTRYETAALVADEVLTANGAKSTVFVVRGDSFPDALAAAPFSYAQGMPILLTPTAYLDRDTESVIDLYDIDLVFIAGGTSAVSLDTEAAIRAVGGGTAVNRIAGTSRYHTAAKLVVELAANYGFNSFEMVGVATGRSFPDALAGGTAMGYENGILLLTPPDALDSYAVAVVVNSLEVGDDVTVFGGEAAINTGGTLIDLWDTIP